MNKKIILFIIMAFFLISIVFAQQELPIGIQRLRNYQLQLAGSITLFIAFFAGLISFTSPCGIAFLPAFFSLAFKDRKKTMQMASAFAAGLIIAFAIFGLIAGLLGDFFNVYKLAFAVVSGWILVLFAILLFFNISFGILNFKIDYSNKSSFLSMMLLGFFFWGWLYSMRRPYFAWYPCAFCKCSNTLKRSFDANLLWNWNCNSLDHPCILL